MTEIIQTLKAAISGLVASQDEAPPFEVFYHVNPNLTSNNLKFTELLTWTGHETEVQVEQEDLSDFLLKLSNTRQLKNHLPQLSKLQTILHQNLSNIQVYHINYPDEETYIIGQDEEGNFAGLKT
ncbi:MAG: nuclease A inhibitor family protein, partial [Bacteroidota bacterium]|nr:nuclease A inhibitor family protein [Bacteroidota bacterium]